MKRLRRKPEKVCLPAARPAEDGRVYHNIIYKGSHPLRIEAFDLVIVIERDGTITNEETR